MLVLSMTSLRHEFINWRKRGVDAWCLMRWQWSLYLAVEQLVCPVSQLAFLAVHHRVREPSNVPRRLPYLSKTADKITTGNIKKNETVYETVHKTVSKVVNKKLILRYIKLPTINNWGHIFQVAGGVWLALRITTQSGQWNYWLNH